MVSGEAEAAAPRAWPGREAARLERRRNERRRLKQPRSGTRITRVVSVESQLHGGSESGLAGRGARTLGTNSGKLAASSDSPSAL